MNIQELFASNEYSRIVCIINPYKECLFIIE